jgi:hypothetical protein
MFQPASAMSQPASVTHALLALSPVGAIQEVWPCVEPPSLGPFEAIGQSSTTCSLTRPHRPSAGRRVRLPQPPSVGSRIADSPLSC